MISEVGTFKQLLAHEGDFADFIREYLHEQEEEGEEGEDSLDPEGQLENVCP